MLSKKDKHGIWLIGVVLAALIGVFVVKATLDSKPKPGPDNCVGEITANTVILLDHSEKIPTQTLDEIASRTMAHIRESVKINERVSIFTISELTKQNLKPLVSLCRPPDEGNRAIENVAQIRKRFQERFEKPVREALAIAPGNSSESPIAQAVTDISLSQYLRGKSNSLLIFSDMLENTNKFSLYKCSSSEDIVSRYRDSRRGAMERPEFKNTSVALNLVPRLDQPKMTIKCRDTLWVWFFGNNSGSQASLKVDYLPGGPAVTNSPSGTQK